MPGLDERRDEDPDGVIREERGGPEEDEKPGGRVVHPKRGLASPRAPLCSSSSVQSCAHVQYVYLALLASIGRFHRKCKYVVGGYNGLQYNKNPIKSAVKSPVVNFCKC